MGRYTTTRRMLDILTLLEQGEVITADLIMDRFEVSPAQAYRDLQFIKKARPGISAKTLDRVQQVIMRRDRLDVSLNQGLGLAVCISRHLMNVLEGTFIASEMRQFQRTLLDGLSTRDPQLYRNIGRKFYYHQPSHSVYEAFDDDLDAVVTSLLRQNPFTAEYTDFKGDSGTVTIIPYSLIIHRSSLYVMGRRYRRDEVRVFRIDRMRDVHRQRRETFEYPEEVDFDPERVLEHSFGIFFGGDFEAVEVILHERWRPFSRHYRWHRDQKVRDLPDGRVAISMRVKVCPELESWVLSFGGDIEVTTPVSLRRRIQSRLRAALSRYDDDLTSDVAT